MNKIKSAKEIENKKFITSMFLIGAITIGTIASILSSTLGGNTKIESHDEEDDSDRSISK